MTDWPRYRSRKIVQATPIVQIGEATGYGTRRVLFVDPHGSGSPEPFSPSESAMRDRAEIGWYAVIYEDGYQSVSPPDVFEAGNTRIAP